MKQRGKQQGFTIIELVVVILLLGILTATALPRFGGLTNSAHQAVVDAVFASLVTSDNLFEAQWYADGQPVNAATITGYGTLMANASGNTIGTTDSFLDDATHTTCLTIYNQFMNTGAGAVTIEARAFDTDEETTVEGGTPSTNDFVASTDAATGAATQCIYYYVGQFNQGTASSSVTIPKIIYTPATGVWSTGTAALNSD